MILRYIVLLGLYTSNRKDAKFGGVIHCSCQTFAVNLYDRQHYRNLRGLTFCVSVPYFNVG